ncbi:hypothetical protein J1605_003679 [Eschrichtius robustus]|uniref:CHORD domain-containing protein n=1 Tax=Eschrichtius robustus TaxID=9764 RepID=A0AB34HRD3_ESCRO|nr:hypothetical protein J1605_003679 [Eschrichtius robustus]
MLEAEVILPTPPCLYSAITKAVGSTLTPKPTFLVGSDVWYSIFPSLILLPVSTDSCCHHPGVPIFHDALKKCSQESKLSWISCYQGWSCCRKRTVDFSEFLNIKGCTVGPHCAEKLPETPQPEGPATSSSLQEQKPPNTIPKSAETLRRERPK